MKIKQASFSPAELEVVRTNVPNAREPRLAIGNFVSLNSGGAPMIVVETSQGIVTTAWRDRAGKTHEHTFPNQCLKRTTIDDIQSSI